MNSSAWTIPTGIPGIPYMFSMNPFLQVRLGCFQVLIALIQQARPERLQLDA